MIKKGILLFSTLLAGCILGCSVQDASKINRHQGEVARKSAPESAATQRANAKPQMANLPVDSPWQGYNQLIESTDDEQILAALESLADFLLNPDHLEHPEWKIEEQSSQGVDVLNRLLIAHYDRLSSNPKFRSVLERYNQTLWANCQVGGATLDNCAHLAFFARVATTSDVQTRLALEQEEIRSKYRFLLMSVETARARRAESEMAGLWLNDIVSLLKTYIDVIDRAPTPDLRVRADMTAQERSELVLYANITSKFLTSDASLIPEDILATLFLWSESEHLDDIFGTPFARAISALTVSNIHHPSVWPVLQQIVENNESGADGYSSKVRELTSKNAKLLESLGIVPIDFAKLDKESDDLVYFHMVSQVYRGVSFDKVLKYWNATDQDAVRFLEMMESFIRVEMVDLALRSSSKLAEYYRDHEASGRGHEELIARYMEWARLNVVPKWMEFHGKVHKVKTLFQGNIEKSARYASNGASSELIARSKELFQKLDRNIKYMVTYPNMLFLAYYAAKTNFSLTVSGFGMTLTFDKDVVMNYFMNAEFSPYIILTNSGKTDFDAIDKVEIMYSIYYAVQLGLFDLYGISVKEFVDVFFSKYFEKERSKTFQWSQAYDDLIGSAAGPREMLNACSLFKTNPGARHAFTNSIDLKTLERYTFFGTESVADARSEIVNTVKAIQSIKESEKYARNPDEVLEFLRSEFDPKVRTLVAFRYFLSERPDLYAEQLDSVDALLAEVRGYRDALVEKVENFYWDVRECLHILATTEEQRQLEIFRMELAWAEKIHETLLIANRHGNVPLSSIEEQDRIRLDINEQSEDMLLVDALNVRNLNDSVFEIANSKIRGYKSDRQRHRPFQVNSSGEIFYSWRRFDHFTRVAYFLERGKFGDLQLTNQWDRPEVQYPDNYEILADVLSSTNSRKPNILNMRLVSHLSDDPETSLEVFKKAWAFNFLNQSDWIFNHLQATTFIQHSLRIDAAILKDTALRFVGDREDMTCDRSCWSELEGILKPKFDHMTDLLALAYHRFNINSDYESVLRLLNRHSRFSSIAADRTVEYRVPKYIFVRDSLKFEYNGFLDEVFNHLVSIRLGRAPIHRGYMPSEILWRMQSEEQTAKEKMSITGNLGPEDLIYRPDLYADAEKTSVSLKKVRDRILFDISDGALGVITSRFTLPIVTDMRLADWFIRQSRQLDLEKEYGIQSMKFDLLAPVNDQPWVLSENLVAGYLWDIKQFNLRTFNVYVPDELRRDERWAPRNIAEPVDDGSSASQPVSNGAGSLGSGGASTSSSSGTSPAASSGSSGGAAPAPSGGRGR